MALALAAALGPAGPLRAQTPFRGDEIEDRDFKYTEDYFLTVLSYRLPYEWRAGWPWVDSGFQGTAGSLRASEFYVSNEARIRPRIGRGFRFHFRYDEKEDFDSRYRRVELGIERDIARGLSAELFGEILPEKAGDDVGLAIWWRPGPRKYLRLSGILPDVIYNRKSDEGDYARKPWTLCLEGEADLSDAWTAGFIVQENFPLELERPADGLVFRYRQFKARAHLEHRLRGGAEIAIDGALEDTRKAYRYAADPGRDFHRFAGDGGIEVRHRLGCHRLWYGARFFRLWERKDYLPPGEVDETLGRRELPLYAGGEIPLWADLRFRPELLLMYPGSRSFQAKLALGVLWRIADRARAVINPTLDLDEGRFGGGQVALQIEL